jgi:glycosyltransferase involved in cell wall biosynthesis
MAVEADRVIAITDALKDELVRRGVAAAKITVVPNSVDTDRFGPAPRDRELESRLDLQGKRVVGYVGSFLAYEGLDDLLHVTNLLIQGGTDFRLLLVGDGAEYPRLKQLVSDLRLDEVVILTGRVPFDEVPRYYSLIDIAPFPRKPLPVTEMVSPLKPFEAMAMEKAVLVSSVAALKEIVIDGETGLVFEKGNWSSMAEQLELLVRDPERCTRLGRNARQWVMRHRSWDRAAADVADVYRALRPNQ